MKVGDIPDSEGFGLIQPPSAAPPDARISNAAAAVQWPFQFLRHILYNGVVMKFRALVNFTGAGVTVTDDGSRIVVTIPGGGGGSLAVQDEGVALTARSTMNFVGAAVTAADDAPNTRTNVTVQAYATTQDEGVALTQRSIINFIGPAITAVDNAGATRTDVTVAIPSAYATVQDEGVALTQRSTMNFVGTGVTATDSGAVTTVTIPGGGGSVTMTEVEVDFGSTPTWSTRFTITDATIVATSKILVSQSGNTATGRVGTDDAEFDSIDYAATPGTGSMVMHALATPGPVVGRRKLFYTVG